MSFRCCFEKYRGPYFELSPPVVVGMMLPFSCAPSSSSSSSYSASSATTGSPASCASDDDGSGDGGDEETDQRLVDGNVVPAVAEASIASSSMRLSMAQIWLTV